MQIQRIKVGLLQTNCYLLEKNNQLIVIDPGDEKEKILAEVKGREVLAVLLTHRHFDHIGALSIFPNIPIYEYQNLEEKEYHIGPFVFQVLYTPGHTLDSVTYYFQKEEVMFTGDFLFHEDIGRTDLEGGSIHDMKVSLQKMKQYPGNIRLFPGHEEDTTLAHELQYNNAFQMLEY